MIGDLRRRLRERLDGLSESEQFSADVRSPSADAPDSPPEAAQQRTRADAAPGTLPRGTVRVEFAPGEWRDVPAAIFHDLMRGCGWSRPSPPGRLALPSRGPLVIDQREDEAS